MNTILKLSLFLILCCGSTLSANEYPLNNTQEPVVVTIVSETETIQAGSSFFVALNLKIAKGWHAYWKNPGDNGQAPIVEWDLPEGIVVKEMLWPTPTQFSLASSHLFGYEDELILLVEMTAHQNLSQKEAKIQGNIQWLVCSHDTCFPGDSDISLNLPLDSKLPIKSERHQDLFTKTRNELPKKPANIFVTRENKLLTVLIESEQQKLKTIHKVEFFPEQQTSIDSKKAPLWENLSNNPSSCRIILEELSSLDTLKGVMVLHTSQEKIAYAVETPISYINPKEIAYTPLNTQTQEGITPIISEMTKENEFDFKGGLSLALWFAFIGGMLLNLMPCVLPVISFKILGFIKIANESRKIIFKHGLAFSLGVLLSFWILASVLLGLQAYGRSVGWGFQLQEPIFVAILASFIYIFGLSLFGLFELGTSIMAKAGEVSQKTSSKKQLLSSFLSGIFATAVATPCTGPFLGSAVGFAFTLPAIQALLIFTFLGLGMSFPYLALAAFPKLLKVLPKPGAWMVTFKELMGFLMMGSVIWLVWVFSAETSTTALMFFLVGLFFISIACWIFGKWTTVISNKKTRLLGAIASMLFLILGSYIIVEASLSPTQTTKTNHAVGDVWEEFSPTRLAELKSQGIPVFIDFTAKWCLICQANHLVLSTDEVAKTFENKGVVRMKADWTNKNEEISKELKKFGRNSVPLYVFYDDNKDSKGEILPQLLTPSIVIDTMNKI